MIYFTSPNQPTKPQIMSSSSSEDQQVLRSKPIADPGHFSPEFSLSIYPSVHKEKSDGKVRLYKTADENNRPTGFYLGHKLDL